MGRKSLSKRDYEALGAEHQLELKCERVPNRTSQKVTWKCLKCERIIERSYHSIAYNRYPCICRSPISYTANHYKILAARMSLEWIGEVIPKNTRAETRWRNAMGDEFDASYWQLAHMTPKRLIPFLEGSNLDDDS